MKGRYCYSYNGENYHGDFGTIDELKHDVGGDISGLKIGIYGDPIQIMTDGNDIAEFIAEAEWDNQDCQLEESIFEYMKKGAQEELARRLDEVLEKFRAEYPIAYYSVIEVEGE